MIRLFILITLVLSIGCGPGSPDYSVTMTSKSGKIYPDSLVEMNLSAMYPFAAVSDDNAYIAIANYRDPIQVVIMDSAGNFISKIGSQGRGPDEIQSARYFGFDGNEHIAILDKTLALIKRFRISDAELAGSYASPVRDGTGIFSNVFHKCGNNWVLAIRNIDEEKSDSMHIVGIFDDTFNLVRSFGNQDPFFANKISVSQNPSLAVDCDNAVVYTTHDKVPFIQSFNLNTGEFIARSEFIPPSFNLSSKFVSRVEDVREMREFMIKEQSVTKLLHTDENYIYLIFRNDTEQFYESFNYWDRDFYVAIFTKADLEFIYEQKIAGAPLGTTEDGEMIVLNHDGENMYFEILGFEVTKIQYE